jgi:hypothetical protein
MCVLPQLHIPMHLPRRAPDVLEEAVLLCEPVEAVVALAHGADETADGVGLGLAGVATVLVNLGDADLDGTMVLGPDDATGGRLGGISIAIRNQVEVKGWRVLTHLGDISVAVQDYRVGLAALTCGGRRGRRARRVRSPF